MDSSTKACTVTFPRPTGGVMATALGQLISTLVAHRELESAGEVPKAVFVDPERRLTATKPADALQLADIVPFLLIAHVRGNKVL